MSTETKPCWIFDIDGTLADCDHRRKWLLNGPKNWKAFNAAMADDTLIEHVAQFVYIARNQYKDVVFCSGREAVYRDVTVTWLVNKLDMVREFVDKRLWMRPAGDYRDDSIIKSELLDQILAAGYKPELVFDDRDRVVSMWREREIPCFQVAPGNF